MVDSPFLARLFFDLKDVLSFFLRHEKCYPMISLFRFSALVAFVLSSMTIATAHPHVWVSVQAELVMDGKLIKAVNHRWTFDEAFSAFATQGLDENQDGTLTREELQPLAQVNVESLSEYDYFSDLYRTGAKEGDEAVFADPTDYWLSKGTDKLTLHFTLPVVAKLDASQELTLDVYDPSFFVDFSFAEKKAASVIVAQGGEPAACKVAMKAAEALDDETMGLLAQIPADQREIPEELMKMTSTMANQVLLTCK